MPQHNGVVAFQERTSCPGSNHGLCTQQREGQERQTSCQTPRRLWIYWKVATFTSHVNMGVSKNQGPSSSPAGLWPFIILGRTAIQSSRLRHHGRNERALSRSPCFVVVLSDGFWIRARSLTVPSAHDTSTQHEFSNFDSSNPITVVTPAFRLARGRLCFQT